MHLLFDHFCFNETAFHLKFYKNSALTLHRNQPPHTLTHSSTLHHQETTQEKTQDLQDNMLAVSGSIAG